MKKLLLIALLVLAGCERPPVGITLPSYACAVTPTGYQEAKKERQYCGKACSREVDVTYYEVKYVCEYKELRRGER